nr:pentapeptide repeat-containing protein [Magnetospirillum sulfuroxidans]
MVLRINPLFTVLFSLIATSAWANDKENVNPSCQLVPEANCGWAELRKLKAPGIDLHDGQFMATRLDEADLTGANLSGSHMQLANFQKATLKNVDFSGSHMHAVNLVGANLEGANLEGVNFLDANLSGANLKGANITRVLWMAANLSGAIWIDGRVCAEGSKGECR